MSAAEVIPLQRRDASDPLRPSAEFQAKEELRAECYIPRSIARSEWRDFCASHGFIPAKVFIENAARTGLPLFVDRVEMILREWNGGPDGGRAA